MKVKELYEAVAKLGFQDNLEDTTAFFAAANRAMLQINAIRPRLGIVTNYASVPENLYSGAHFGVDIHSGGERLEFESSGDARSWCFEVMGEGAYSVEAFSNGAWDKLPNAVENFSNKSFERFAGITEGAPLRIVFTGEHTYRIRGVAFYRESYSSNPADVPVYSKYSGVDMWKLVPDFLDLDRDAFTDRNGREIKDYVIADHGVILLPRESADEALIKYKRAPKKLVHTNSPTVDETQIELDAELAELMPILVSVYIWLDEEDEKAGTYLKLYRERAAEIERRIRSKEPVPMRFNSF